MSLWFRRGSQEDPVVLAKRLTAIERQLNISEIVAGGTGTGLISIAAGGVQVDLYTTPGAHTWTKPAGTVAIVVEAQGPGGGGGGGAGSASAVNRPGGGAGSGGGRTVAFFSGTAIPDTADVQVGTAGTGGAGGSTANGSNGTDATASWVRVSATDYLAHGAGGKAGTGGQLNQTSASGGNFAGAGGALFPGGNGGQGFALANGGDASDYQPHGIAALGGGGGGGLNSSGTTRTGGRSSHSLGYGWQPTALDIQAMDETARVGRPGLGGDGGGSSNAGTGADGEDGVSGGGGGGGGAGNPTGGAGGGGGAGWVRIISYIGDVTEH